MLLLLLINTVLSSEIKQHYIMSNDLIIDSLIYSKNLDIVNKFNKIILNGYLLIDKGFNFKGDFIMESNNSFPVLEIKSIFKCNKFIYKDGILFIPNKKFNINFFELNNKLKILLNNIYSEPFSFEENNLDKIKQIFKYVKELKINYNNTLINCNLKLLNSKSLHNCIKSNNNQSDDNVSVAISCPTNEEEIERFDYCPENFTLFN